MKRLFSAAILAALTTITHAETQQTVVIDRELWATMNVAIAETSMPLSAHQRIQQILQNVEKEAAERAARAAAKPKEEPK